MEENNETKELEPFQKISVSISTFQGDFLNLIVEGEQGILKAEVLQKQVKAIKSLARSSTEIEWKTKKTIYENSRDETEKKKKEYYEIRDKRNTLINACADVFNGIGKKINDFRAECVRKAEAETKRIADELKAKQEEERRIQKVKDDAEKSRVKAEKNKLEDAKLAEEQKKIDADKRFRVELVNPSNKEGMKVIKETGVTISTECLVHGKFEGEECPVCIAPPHRPGTTIFETVNKELETDETNSQQKLEEGQVGVVVNELDILNNNIWDAICGDLESFELEQVDIIGKWRHGTVERAIVRSKSSGKLYQSNFSDSCKDEMCFGDMNYGESANFSEIENEIEIEITDMKKFIRSVMLGERGATFDLIQPNIKELTKLAKEYNCKPGDIIIDGCRVKG